MKIGDLKDLVPRRLKAIRKCRNCGITLKNVYRYWAYAMSVIKVNEERNETNIWFGINKECRRCGHLNIAQ